MKAVGIVARGAAVAALAGLAGIGAAAAQGGDLDCYQFGSWDAAQGTYQQTVQGSGWDWMRLDEDGDGIACECLYYGYPCWTPWG